MQTSDTTDDVRHHWCRRQTPLMQTSDTTDADVRQKGLEKKMTYCGKTQTTKQNIIRNDRKTKPNVF